MYKTNYSVKLTVIIMSIFTGIMFLGYIVLRTTVGSCPRFDPLDSIDVEAFKGVWYELQRDSTIGFQTGECVTAQYGDYENDRVSVENVEYFPWDSTYAKINGYATANTWYPGWINVFLAGVPFGADYRIVSTDYTSYAIVYSCTSIGPVKYPEFSWLLTRD